MQTFNFKNKAFDFPIGVYLNFPKKLIIFLAVVMILFCVIVLTVSIKNNNLFGVLIILFFGVILTALAFLYKKPRFIIYPDKLVFTEHGLINKELSWRDCILRSTYNQHHSTGKEIPLLHFGYKTTNGEMERFAYLNLAYIRFDNEHFDKNNSLKFFEQIKAFSEKL